jgi:hypothetical protein
LERALNRCETNAAFSQLSYLAKARELAKCVMQGVEINNIVADYRRITPDDIRRVASDLLRRERSNTLVYRSRPE